jgi:hypothetical protein
MLEKVPHLLRKLPTLASLALQPLAASLLQHKLNCKRYCAQIHQKVKADLVKAAKAVNPCYHDCSDVKEKEARVALRNSHVHRPVERPQVEQLPQLVLPQVERNRCTVYSITKSHLLDLSSQLTPT